MNKSPDSQYPIATSMVRVFLVDDHAVVRQGTLEILKRDPKILVVGEADSAADLPRQLNNTQPNILLLDINLSDGNALRFIPGLKEQFGALKIIAFSAYTDAQYVQQALKLGADGFLSKLTGEVELREALHQACGHSPEQQHSKKTFNGSDAILSQDIRQLLSRRYELTQTLNLTAREHEILQEISRGRTNQNIAERLFLSVKTVDTHVANLIRKTNVANRTQLVAYAYEHRLV